MDVNSPLKRAWAVNLSKGGMFIHMTKPFPVGTHLLIALDGVQEIRPLAEATVVWQREVQGEEAQSSPPGVGVMFKTLKADAGILLDTLVDAGGFTTTPPQDLVLWPEPSTPVVHPTPPPMQDKKHSWAAISMPHVGVIRLRSADGELRVELESQTVEHAESNPHGVVLKTKK